MSRPLDIDEGLLEETAEDLYENAPCGYLSTDPGGLIVKLNATFLEWTGYARDDLVGARRFQELLSAGGRIYYETHYAPLLQMQGRVREIAIEIARADGSLLPALVNSVMRSDAQGRPQIIRTTVFDATDRRRYERALLAAHRREREIVAELQRSMLSGPLPTGPKVEVGVAYSAAGDGLEVGGDWYDAFWLDGEAKLALVVGDVVGRGLEAAATMGQLRSAVRALAATGLGPASLLDALERFVRRHEVGASTTVVYAEVDLEHEGLTWACAGHPPPLLMEHDAQPTFLWAGRSPPLDAWFEEAPRRPEGNVSFGRGDALLLYTDGLVERRTMTIDEGMARLQEDLSRRRTADARRLADSVFRALRVAEHVDDVCLLAFRATG